jgi:hypothetical protein
MAATVLSPPLRRRRDGFSTGLALPSTDICALGASEGHGGAS